LAGDFVRDKDAISGCCLIAEIAAWAASQGKTMYDILVEIYQKYGFFHETLLSIVRKGKSGSQEIVSMMKNFRENSPLTLLGQRIIKAIDYLDTAATQLPQSNVLQWFLEDGTKISMRPSGTEPKLKFYFGVASSLSGGDILASHAAMAEEKIEKIKQELHL
jgi:phosphoglucomutase